MKRILPIIVFAQFCCTSLWFAGNSVMDDLSTAFHFDNSAIGHLTSSVQFGFITGTLLFALLTIADRFSPSRVFFISALAGASFNLAVIWEGHTLYSLLLLRFMTGFFLAGIYPIGMKIASDYFDQGLGKSLGWLVGALVVGTASPHLIKAFIYELPWRLVVVSTSALATLGGLLMIALVPDGPFRKASQGLNLSACLQVFRKADFRAAAFGYFGHMWELYTFWAFVPLILKTYQSIHPGVDFNIPLLSFIIIGSGGLACVVGSYLADRWGNKKIACTALFLSGLCCLCSPIFFAMNSSWVFVTFLLCWGLVVIADSPLFSTLVAQNAPASDRGTALTIVNCIGFSITIVSLQVINLLITETNAHLIYMVLAIGPILGLLGLFGQRKIKALPL